MENKEYPLEMNIEGIKTVIVDPHNEVFTYWHRERQQNPLSVLHVDKHDDMDAGRLSFERFKQRHLGTTIEEYARYLCIGIYIVHAVHYGIVNLVYFFDPRTPEYTKFYSSKTLERDGVINWDPCHPDPQKFDIETAIKNLNQSKGHILDIDLDAFASIDDYHLPVKKEDIDNRLEVTLKIIRQIKRPDLITIARSLNPRSYTVPNLVELLQEKCVTGLHQVFVH